MRFEESQVSVFNPETGVNTVEASIFMILRAGPTHTCDIKMQQVPTLFGNAPGIVVRSRVLCSALLLCTALLGVVGPSHLSLSFSMLVMPDVCLVWEMPRSMHLALAPLADDGAAAGDGRRGRRFPRSCPGKLSAAPALV